MNRCGLSDVSVRAQRCVIREGEVGFVVADSVVRFMIALSDTEDP